MRLCGWVAGPGALLVPKPLRLLPALGLVCPLTLPPDWLGLTFTCVM